MDRTVSYVAVLHVLTVTAALVAGVYAYHTSGEAELEPQEAVPSLVALIVVPFTETPSETVIAFAHASLARPEGVQSGPVMVIVPVPVSPVEEPMRMRYSPPPSTGNVSCDCRPQASSLHDI